jgi:hypothetical protein
LLLESLKCARWTILIALTVQSIEIYLEIGLIDIVTALTLALGRTGVARRLALHT